MRKQKAQSARNKTLKNRMAEYYRLGQWLKGERLRAGLTHRQVNGLLGTSSSFMYRVEHGLQRLDLIQFLDLVDVLRIDQSISVRHLAALSQPGSDPSL